MREDSGVAEELIRDIEEMRVRGAYLITCVALEALALRAKEVAEKEGAFFDAMATTAERLKAAQPSMASVANACAYVLKPLTHPEAADLTPQEAYRLVTTRSREFLTGFKRAQQGVVEVGARVVRDGDVVFVHSYSGTLLGILHRAREEGKRFTVIATESRPYCEGREMVAQLLKQEIPCTLIIDMAAGTYLRRATKALVGGDAILANGSIVNKMGTQLVALACHAYGIPFYAAASILKFSLQSLQGDKVKLLERPDDAGIAPSALADMESLQVENRIFDVTPARYIEALITDRGLLSPAAVAGFRDDPLLCPP